MKYYCTVDFKEVSSEWAIREKVPLQQLLHNRDPLIKRLPKDTVWFKVNVDKNDFASFRVIGSDIGWQIVSDFNCEIPSVARNTETPPKINSSLAHQLLPDGRTIQKYVSDLVEGLRKFRESAGDKNHNLTLILIAPIKEGPFTILEGNHAAVGLYFRHFVDHPELPYPPHTSYVGISPSMEQCLWY